MVTFVLCHGAFSGGWIWREVATFLRTAGHEVHTPTFTGSGERVHLAHPDIDLDTHIRDISLVLEYEALHDVVLVGYSYSGMVISGVADSLPERVSQMIYLDAFVPHQDCSIAELVGQQVMVEIINASERFGDNWRIPHNYNSAKPPAPRRTDLILKTVLQPLHLRNASAALIPRSFIFCTDNKADLGPLGKTIAQAGEEAKSRSNWSYNELKSGHFPWETAPKELADLLIQIAQRKRS